MNGIYFFYEDGEYTDHGQGSKPRITRIGTNKGQGNFRNRITEHFLLNASKMDFTSSKAKPSDRSVFRNNLGSAPLNRQKSEYLKIWELNFTTSENRQKYAQLRDVEKEKVIEAKITDLLRRNFYFRFIVIEEQDRRVGSSGLESKLIGTVSSCSSCQASKKWLGKYSPKLEISNGKLWLSNFLNNDVLSTKDMETISIAIQIQNTCDR